jgi:hypothetical protein
MPKNIKIIIYRTIILPVVSGHVSHTYSTAQHSDDKIEKNELIKGFSTYGGGERCIQGFVREM